MEGPGRACIVLLMAAAACSGRNAAFYFQQENFLEPPARPEDALVISVAGAPRLACEPDRGECGARNGSAAGDSFCLALPRGFSHYRCRFDGPAPADSYLRAVRERLPHLFSPRSGRLRMFSETKLYCTADSQLPDEYFQLTVRRPHEDGAVRCRLLNDSARLHLRFPGYPTVVCYVGPDAGRYRFNLPGVDDQLRCAFRVYSELPLGDQRTERRLHEGLAHSLPRRVDGDRPRLHCSREPSGESRFELLLHGGHTFHCHFPDHPPRYVPEWNWR